MKIIKVLFVVGCIFMVDQSFAQVRFDLGIKGGLNFAKLNGSESLSQNYSNRTGYHFGAYALFKFSKIGIQPEVLFSKQGSKFSVNTNNFDANFSYVNVPVIVKLYTVAGINIQVGPQIGFLSGGNLKQTVGGVTTTTAAKDFAKGSDWSLAMGLGWDLPLGLSVSGRYNLGLSNNNNTGASGSVKNQVIQVSVGYRLFKLGK